jgi:hypothetical protein
LQQRRTDDAVPTARHIRLLPNAAPTVDTAIAAMAAKLAPQLAKIERIGIERHRADPNGFPMERGRIQRFDDFMEDGFSTLRYKTIRLGKPVIMHMPTEYMTAEVESNFADTVEVAEQKEDARGPGLVE